MSRNFGRPSDVFQDNQSDSDADEGDETGIVEDDGGEDTMISGGDFDRGYVLITSLNFICLWYMKANIHK